MSDRVQKTITPVDGSVYLERELASGGQVEAALAKAASAQRQWRHVPIAQRVDACRRMVDWFVERAEPIGTELTWQIGRPVAYTPMEIRRGFQERVGYMADIAEEALADIVLEPREGFRRFIRREPLGVVLVLAPWNYPYLASVNAVVPAILAGNAVILKVSGQTPRVAEHYAEGFAHAGLPDGVYQFLHVTHDDVAGMIEDPRIGYVAFTGSVPGGRAVQRAAAGRFIATGLELGGKDPAYVRADAPMQGTVENLVDGVYFNSGQSCCAVERIYVHRSVFDEFVDRFVDLTRQYVLGNPLLASTTLGPMVRTSAAEFVRIKVDEAVRQGATALIDAREFPADGPGTPYLMPQVLLGVSHRMRIMTEETFGPAVGLMPVADDEEAIRLMNDSSYGLTASVWTSDPEAAVRIGDRVESGTCYMNRCDYLDPALAWTGVKDSGHGCTLSRLGYDALTRPKSFHLRLQLA